MSAQTVDPGVDQIAVSVSGAVRTFGNTPALNGVDLTIRAGEFVALVGKSGSGKTTLLRLLAGLDQVDEGTVLVPERRTVVFQEPRLIPSKRVWRNVVVGLGRDGQLKSAAHDALAEVDLVGHEDDWPVTLSGGEAQRVALARALVRRPQLLLLDEPFAALDALTRLNMQRLILKLHEVHRPATMIVTHDVDEAITLADRIVVLREGQLASEIEVPTGPEARPGGPVFVALRVQLLRELGVAVEEPS